MKNKSFIDKLRDLSDQECVVLIKQLEDGTPKVVKKVPLSQLCECANHPTIHVNRLPDGHFADCPNHPDNKKKNRKSLTKKQLKELAWQKDCEKLSVDLNKVFTEWDDANNKGMPWENSLGPKARTIRENLFGAGFHAAEKYWKRRLLNEGWKKP